MLDAFCDLCGREVEVLVGSRDTVTRCECGKKMRYKYSNPPKIKVDFVPGFDIGLGVDIQTKAQRDAILEEKGLRKVRD